RPTLPLSHLPPNLLRPVLPARLPAQAASPPPRSPRPLRLQGDPPPVRPRPPLHAQNSRTPPGTARPALPSIPPADAQASQRSGRHLRALPIRRARDLRAQPQARSCDRTDPDRTAELLRRRPRNGSASLSRRAFASLPRKEGGARSHLRNEAFGIASGCIQVPRELGKSCKFAVPGRARNRSQGDLPRDRA